MTKTTFDNLMIATIAVILVELNLKVASRDVSITIHYL